MALGRTRTAAVRGVTAAIIDVEVSTGRGLPGISVLGLGDTAVSEARDRIRTACHNLGLPWPRTRIVVSLSPASLPKSGAGFDLAMALAILKAGGSVPADGDRLASTLVLGEIGLNGAIRPVTGVLPCLLAARAAGLTGAVIPRGNAGEAALIPSFPVMIADTLDEVLRWATGAGELTAAGDVGSGVVEPRANTDFADVVGQPEARLAAEIAAAGGHHMLMIGPPGSGKSMIATRLPGILPPLTERECLAATAVHSVAGRTFTGVVSRAPFIAPHHSVTRAALLGGGGSPLPGAVSLAHHGVLFLDEVSEIPARILDCLRTPLDTGAVRILRSRQDVTFPARFQLILAANPCRCAVDDPRRCRCRSGERSRYLNNLSGPLRDRIDLHVRTRARSTVITPGDEETSEVIAERVAIARERAAARWRRAGVETTLTADVRGTVLRREHPADDVAMALLAAHTARGRISQRRVDRTLRVAWTLADLEGRDIPDLDHVARALDHSGVTDGGETDA
ncbi:YifB family Mg chelatase-like AAA ATPase [Corynebacterium meridianum]|uniref:YifB family Mg chelatase-like AAA ATPase n=1 Tax=Corynebacterium meridianum TaxID=2765363 RepID=A0A934HYZ5_9CORY|nr:YifB family Mg chelatase-like AAA ATPase [Corynebacterium meridianum]